MQQWFVVFPAVTDLVSFVASMTLLIWVCRLRRNLANKLMARQLWHLAVSDVLTSACHMVWFALPVLPLVNVRISDHLSVLNNVCKFATFSNIPFIISVFLEVHIALTTVLTIRRCFRATRFLSKFLVLVWPLGGIFAWPLGVIAGKGNVYWDNALQECNVVTLYFEYIKVGIMAGALGLCIATYIGGVLWARHQAAGSAQRRLWNLASWFVAAAVVSWMPYMLYVLVFMTNGKIVSHPDKGAYNVAFSFLLSNGLFNAAVYALQSRFVRQAQRRGSLLAGSYDLRRRAHDPATPHAESFSVAFDVEDEVVEVPAVTHEANTTAEQETAVLEDQLAANYVEPHDDFQTWLQRQASARAEREAAALEDGPAANDVEPEVHFLAFFDDERWNESVSGISLGANSSPWPQFGF